MQETQETWVLSLGWEDLLEEEMAAHSSILAWKIPWTEDPQGCSPWGCKEFDATGHTCTNRRTLYSNISFQLYIFPFSCNKFLLYPSFKSQIFLTLSDFPRQIQTLLCCYHLLYLVFFPLTVCLESLIRVCESYPEKRNQLYMVHLSVIQNL